MAPRCETTAARAVFRRERNRPTRSFRAVRRNRGARSHRRTRASQWTQQLRESTAIVTGSCVGGQTTEDEGFVNLYRNNIPRVNPFTIPRTMENAAASRISLETGVVGPTYTISTACSSSNHAIGQAFWMVRSGAGQNGHHRRKRSRLQPRVSESVGGHARGFARHLPPVFKGPPRPDPGRRRGHAGAGTAGCRPRARRADPGRNRRLRHVVGRVPHHPAFARRRGPRHARRACGRRPSSLDDIGYINAHGTATLANDATETAAIRKVFGAHADRLAVSSTKSMHGHTLGAAGAIEAAATLLALQHGILPAHRQFHRTRSGLRSGRDPQHRPPRCGRVRAFQFLRLWRLECGPGFPARPKLNSGAGVHKVCRKKISLSDRRTIDSDASSQATQRLQTHQHALCPTLKSSRMKPGTPAHEGWAPRTTENIGDMTPLPGTPC